MSARWLAGWLVVVETGSRRRLRLVDGQGERERDELGDKGQKLNRACFCQRKTSVKMMH